MGLDASVRCNCIKEGKALPHPFPELLAFDELEEPTLKSARDADLSLWVKHDDWYRDSCPHSGYLVKKRVGNMGSAAYVRAYVREFLEGNSPNNFPLLLERVIYSGTHSGDWIAASDVPELLTETRRLRGLTDDPLIIQFTNDVCELAEASIATGNPIVF
jgi:hypothetical protein